MAHAVEDHPCATRLNNFLLGKLGEPAARTVEDHLELCEACCERLYDLSRLPGGDPLVARLYRLSRGQIGGCG